MVLQVNIRVNFKKERGIGEWEEFPKKLPESCNVLFFDLCCG